MQNFKKYGVAAAVAAVTSAAIAQPQTTDVDGPVASARNMGDAAIVPYYTALDGKITGVHIINTTASTQALKFRLRRGSDSADAMDFNVVLSPHDEWTAYVGTKDGKVGVGTSDNSCTVPKRLGVEGWADMPSTFAEGAAEGYIEIIGMGQAVSEKYPAAVYATHTKAGTPLDCAMVEKNFYRPTFAQQAASASDTRAYGAAGVHRINVTSDGTCSSAAISAANATTTGYTTACTSAGANLTVWGDTSDTAFKVSYFIREGATEGEGGMEFGDNAVHIEGFSDAYEGGAGNNGTPLMTNQVQIVVDKNSTPANQIVWDPLNFEYPNLGQAVGDTNSAGATALGIQSSGTANGRHFDEIREALDVDYLVNEWADNDNASADWVVTLPGQYAMRDNMCFRYASDEVGTPCANATATLSAGNGGFILEDDQLPLYLLEGATSKISVWNREEKVIAEEGREADVGLDFSPSSTDTVELNYAYLEREVNVLVFGEDDGGVLGSAALQSADHGLKVVIGTPGATEGWAKLTIDPKDEASVAYLTGAGIAPGANIKVADSKTTGSASGAAKYGQGEYTSFHATTYITEDHVPVVGAAFWKREFAGNAAANYGRAIEHSVVGSSTGSYGMLTPSA